MRKRARRGKFCQESLVRVPQPACSSRVAAPSLRNQELQLASDCRPIRLRDGRLLGQVGRHAWLMYCVSQCRCGPTTQLNLISGPTDRPFGHRNLFFRDPEGNVLEIHAEIRSFWSTARPFAEADGEEGRHPASAGVVVCRLPRAWSRRRLRRATLHVEHGMVSRNTDLPGHWLVLGRGPHRMYRCSRLQAMEG